MEDSSSAPGLGVQLFLLILLTSQVGNNIELEKKKTKTSSNHVCFIIAIPKNCLAFTSCSMVIFYDLILFPLTFFSGYRSFLLAHFYISAICNRHFQIVSPQWKPFSNLSTIWRFHSIAATILYFASHDVSSVKQIKRIGASDFINNLFYVC